jgi:hypothetical protein
VYTDSHEHACPYSLTLHVLHKRGVVFIKRGIFFCNHMYMYLRFKICVDCRGRQGHDRMVVGFTTTCGINAYHH